MIPRYSRRAFIFAYKAHGMQFRRTGEPYIHPLATTEILTELEVDVETLCAAMLHDTVEDTSVTVALISEIFGEDITSRRRRPDSKRFPIPPKESRRRQFCKN